MSSASLPLPQGSTDAPGASTAHGPAVAPGSVVPTADIVLSGEATSLTHLFESMPDAVVMLDDRGTIQYLNTQAERLFGYARGELVGRSLECLVPANVRQRHAEHRRRFHAAPHLRRMGDADRLSALRRDGTLVPVDIGLGSLMVSGRPRTLAFVRDHTRIQALLDGLGQARRELEQELERRRQLRALSELLQSPVSREDLRPALSRHLEHLFPHTRGAVFVLDGPGETADRLVDWGEAPESWTAVATAGFRSASLDMTPVGAHTAAQPRRRHAGGAAIAPDRCAPLVANGLALGMLIVDPASGDPPSPEQRRTIGAVADWLGLPLANLRLRERLEGLTYRDPLTGLHNRRYLQEVLAQRVAVARRACTSLALAVIDLDHFKSLNDTWGHGAGDDVLRAFGAMLTRWFRASDTICRYGGEEFVVVCGDSSGADLTAALDEARSKWAGSPIATLAATAIRSTFSAGVAAFPDDATDGDRLLQVADAALYAAKAQGRNRVVGGRRSAPRPGAGQTGAESRHANDARGSFAPRR
ncbi:MAG: diguanylate cyclase [Vicinamibacterales bacterium]